MTRDFDAPLDRVWEAAVRAFAQRNIPIKTLEKASGIIASDAIRGAIPSQLDCGRIERAVGMEVITGTGQGSFNVFLFSSTDKRTSVQVNSRWSTVYYQYDLYGRVVSATPVECTSTGDVERTVLNLIEMDLTRGPGKTGIQ